MYSFAAASSAAPTRLGSGVRRPSVGLTSSLLKRSVDERASSTTRMRHTRSLRRGVNQPRALSLEASNSPAGGRKAWPPLPQAQCPLIRRVYELNQAPLSFSGQTGYNKDTKTPAR